MTNDKTATVIPEPQRDRLRALMAEKGVYAAARIIRCSKGTLDRAIGGLGVLPGTAALIGNALAARDVAGKNP
jgi:hypothetical protein